MANTLQALFGDSQAEQRAKAIDNAVDRLETFRSKMSRLRSKLKDPTKTSFIVVTIPTKLGINESKRLMTELKSQGVSVTDIIVNQVVADFDGMYILNISFTEKGIFLLDRKKYGHSLFFFLFFHSR